VFRTKRIYEPPASSDGFRVLVGRPWPRGLNKQKARVALWLRDVAHRNALRKRYFVHPGQWTQFVSQYQLKLREKSGLLARLRGLEREHGTVTLLFAKRDTVRNNAVALRRFLAKRQR
jgi:uncharacterized protein YeaO (DUF488 family)